VSEHSPEEPLPPEALVLPEDFWEPGLPPVVTDLSSTTDDARAHDRDAVPAADLSLPPLWRDDDADPVTVPELPVDLSLDAGPAADDHVADLPLAALAPEAGPDPRPALPFWSDWWAGEGTARAWPGDADAAPSEDPEPTPIIRADMGVGDVVAPEPVPPAPVRRWAGPSRWADRWSGNGARAAVAAVVLGMAALLAFGGRADPPRSGLVESADPSRTTVASSPPPSSMSALAHATEPAAPAASAAEAGAGGGPGVGAGAGSGGVATAGAGAPTGGGRTGGGATVGGGAGTGSGAARPSPGGGGGSGSTGAPPAGPAPAARSDGGDRGGDQYYYYYEAPDPRPSATGGPSRYDRPASGSTSSRRGSTVDTSPPTEPSSPPANTPATGNEGSGGAPPPTVGDTRIPCEHLPAGRLGCPGGDSP